jgi:beta-xylosidase
MESRARRPISQSPRVHYEIARFSIVSILFAGHLLAQTSNPVSTLSWGDQGDGTYKNPILYSDYSDPDIVRVGDDFYLVASDFNYVGIQVLHSRDLVNWAIIGQVFHRLSMDPKYDQMNGYGQGTWAPSLRFHDGEFYLYVCTPAEGLFMWHTKNPAGPWSEMVTVKRVAKWEDPCPIWDDDGKVYLVHGIKGAGPLILHHMSGDGTTLLDDGKEIYRGPTAEGPKFYKRHGYYFISLPEGGVSTGWQTVLRSKNIYGPYESKQVLSPGSPHQGGIVELDNGQAWFISFKSAGYLGRICYLNPVTWGDDDWPIFGDNGKPVDQWAKPDVGATYPIEKPQVSDEFDEPQLPPMWQWNHNPANSAWSLTDRPGWLRLRSLPADSPADARNTLTQKLWDQRGVVDVHMDISGMADGQRAGFTFISGNTFGIIGVEQSGGKRHVVWPNGIGPEITSSEIYLRGKYDGDVGRFAYSFDGQHFADAPTTLTLKFLFWKGARVGLINYGGVGGFVDVDYFRYRYGDD